MCRSTLGKGGREGWARQTERHEQRLGDMTIHGMSGGYWEVGVCGAKNAENEATSPFQAITAMLSHEVTISRVPVLAAHDVVSDGCARPAGRTCSSSSQ